MKVKVLAWACVGAIVLTLAVQGLHRGPHAPGTIKWKVYSGAGMFAFPAVADGTVYYVHWKTPGFFGNPLGGLFGGEAVHCEVVAIDAGGRWRKWCWDMQGEFVQGPLKVFKDALYIDTGYAIVALDRKSGKVRWRFAKHGSATVSSLMADGSLLCRAPGQDGIVFNRKTGEMGPVSVSVFALDAKTGLEKPVSASEQAMAPPTTVGTEGGFVFRRDTLAGGSIWRFPLQDPSHVGITIAGDAVYVTDGRFVRRLDMATGRENWHIDMGPTEILPVTVSGDNLYFPMMYLTGPHFIVCADRGTGKEKWRCQIKRGAYGPLILADGVLYVLTDQYLYAMYAEPPATN